MPTNQLSLTHLIQYPASYKNDSDDKYPTILALHGRGSNEHDLIGLAPYLPNNLLWISPRGTFTLGFDSYEWFQITQIGKPDPVRLHNTLQIVDHFIDEIFKSYPVDKDSFYLLGFSQGSIVSLSYALTQPQRVTGVIAQSGYLPHDAGLNINEEGLKNKPFLLTHGVRDSMLPVEWARRSYDTLRSLGTDVEYYEFNMEHQVTAESLDMISKWLEKRLKR
jgi:phospholipase/carboxylesterase